MGSVSIDVHKQEREFKELTLSDENVVRYLILFRSKVDKTYGVESHNNIYSASETFSFNQELVALYASLDKAIEKIKIKEKDEKMLKLLFEGYTLKDISEVHGYVRMTAYNTLDRIVRKIVEENKKDWMRFVTVLKEGKY